MHAQKPDGLTVVRPDELPGFLDARSIRVIPGIGPKTEGFLQIRDGEPVEDEQDAVHQPRAIAGRGPPAARSVLRRSRESEGEEGPPHRVRVEKLLSPAAPVNPTQPAGIVDPGRFDPNGRKVLENSLFLSAGS